MRFQPLNRISVGIGKFHNAYGCPTVEIVGTRKYQQDHLLDQLETGYFDGGQDTVVDISLRMKGLEPSGYYRLNVRSLTEKVVDGKKVYDTNDCYHSYDPLFQDIRLSKPRKDGIRISATCLPARLPVAQDMSVR